MKRVCLALCLAAAVASAQSTEGGMVDQVNSFSENINTILTNDGFGGLVVAGWEQLQATFGDWVQQTLETYDRTAYLQGLAVGFSLYGLQLLMPQYGPIFQAFAFAPKFTFQQSYAVLMMAASKVNSELLHQFNGPLTAPEQINEYFSRFETLMDILFVPIQLALGQWYLLGVTIVDLYRNFTFLDFNPWYDYNPQISA